MTPARWDALLNVAVFTPIAYYWARGEKPPDLLIAASLMYTGLLFWRDFRTLLGQAPPPSPPEALRNARLMQTMSGVGPPRPGLAAPAGALRYRVNR